MFGPGVKKPGDVVKISSEYFTSAPSVAFAVGNSVNPILISGYVSANGSNGGSGNNQPFSATLTKASTGLATQTYYWVAAAGSPVTYGFTFSFSEIFNLPQTTASLTYTIPITATGISSLGATNGYLCIKELMG